MIKIAEILEVKVSFLLDEKSEKSIQLKNNQNAQAYNIESAINADQEHIASLKEEIYFLRNLLKPE